MPPLIIRPAQGRNFLKTRYPGFDGKASPGAMLFVPLGDDGILQLPVAASCPKSSRNPCTDLLRDGPFAVLLFEDVETSVSAVAPTEKRDVHKCVSAVAVESDG